jgi:tetratricopeptide (TPR) repeat protein
MTRILLPAARAAASLLLVAFLPAGCATPVPPKPAPPPAPPPAPAAPPPEAPKPAPPPEPKLSPAQAKAQAQKLTVEAITQLQNGDEPSAQKTLEEALKHDPSSDLARKLMDQIKADPQKELGATFFRYTVQRDDSLSKIAQQFLGDRYKFHILAKYNDITNPSKLAAGQVIKVPGRAPAPGTPKPAAPPPAPEPIDEAAKAASPESATPRTASMQLMQQGADLAKAGNLEGAYDAYREAALRDPGNRDATTQRDATRTQLVRRYEREAAQSFQRQNLDDAINKWDRVLALEPANQKARLERERAIDLRKKLNEKFGAK